jgi:hypothetical protein
LAATYKRRSDVRFHLLSEMLLLIHKNSLLVAELMS